MAGSKTPMPKLTIAIPALNEEKTLPILLRSIQEQRFTDYEVVIANSVRTTDRTAAVAEAFGARVVSPSPSPGAGRNVAARHAKGDILLFLDADVVLPNPEFLKSGIAEFERRGFGTATCRVDPLSKNVFDKAFHEAFNYFMAVTSDVLPHAPGFCIFARRSVHEAIGGFDEEIRLAEDHDYVYRASKLAKFGLLKSCRIPVSVRRLERDGRFNILVKYVFAELYMRTKGQIKTDFFNYEFGYDEGKGKRRLSPAMLKRRLEKAAKDFAETARHELGRPVRIGRRKKE